MQFQLKLVFLFIAVIAVDSRRSNREPEGCKKLFSFFGDVTESCSWKDVSYMPKRILMQTDSTCASFAVSYALEFLYSKEQNRPIQGSSQWLCDKFPAKKIYYLLDTAFKSYCISDDSYPYTPMDPTPTTERSCLNSTVLDYTYDVFIGSKLSFDMLKSLIDNGPIIAVIKPSTRFRNFSLSHYQRFTYYNVVVKST
ncbi:hypothetical protein M3Y95_01188200 [Aphelenchoides besseyi]|nr:hypothetical protein M3Y95_01188200 [Aphelenchoides besseyi]